MFAWLVSLYHKIKLGGYYIGDNTNVVKTESVQECTRDAATRKRVAAAIKAQEQMMNARAMCAHSVDCRDIFTCVDPKCFKRVPMRIVGTSVVTKRSKVSINKSFVIAFMFSSCLFGSHVVNGRRVVDKSVVSDVDTCIVRKNNPYAVDYVLNISSMPIMIRRQNQRPLYIPGVYSVHKVFVFRQDKRLSFVDSVSYKND